eukprot:jgi/Pico_ML_1/53518/g4053.t1
MADTRSLAQLGASTSDASRLAARGVRTASDLMRSDLLDVADALRVSVQGASRALCRVAKAVAPSATDVASMRRMDASGHLPTKISPLDAAMRGGLPPRAITELAGPAGAGKTQMCFALLLSAALPTTYGDRRLSVAKSPSMPPLSFSFAITASGLVPLTAGGEVPTL